MAEARERTAWQRAQAGIPAAERQPAAVFRPVTWAWGLRKAAALLAVVRLHQRRVGKELGAREAQSARQEELPPAQGRIVAELRAQAAESVRPLGVAVTSSEQGPVRLRQSARDGAMPLPEVLPSAAGTAEAARRPSGLTAEGCLFVPELKRRESIFAFAARK